MFNLALENIIRGTQTQGLRHADAAQGQIQENYFVRGALLNQSAVLYKFRPDDHNRLLVDVSNCDIIANG